MYNYDLLNKNYPSEILFYKYETQLGEQRLTPVERNKYIYSPRYDKKKNCLRNYCIKKMCCPFD